MGSLQVPCGGHTIVTVGIILAPSDRGGAIFGEKTAYSRDGTPRELDLDATFETIIRPAVEGAGLRCIRADQRLNAGMIDSGVYEMLLGADLVVADISTGNVNAVYQLGVRHALRSRSHTDSYACSRSTRGLSSSVPSTWRIVESIRANHSIPPWRMRLG